MRKAIKRLIVEARRCDSEAAWECSAKGLPRVLDERVSRFLVRFFEQLQRPSERLILGFRPFLEERWQPIAATDWTTIEYTPERYDGRRVIEFGWVMGFAHTPQKLAEAFRFAWNNYINDQVFLVVASERTNGTALSANRHGAGPGDECQLAAFYPVVMGPYWDAQWLTIATNRFEPQQLVECLRRAAGDDPLPIELRLAGRPASRSGAGAHEDTKLGWVRRLYRALTGPGPDS